MFDAVLRAGSMSSAALELRYSPAAVSQQIAALEVEAGTPLLKRLPRGVEPTAAGEVAGRHARLIVQQLASASAAIDAVARGTSGPLRIASFPGATGRLLPDALLRLRSQRPDLAVSVEDREAEAALAGLRDGTIDLAIVADFSPDEPIETGGLEAAPLGRATVSVMLPVGHPLAASDVIPLVALLDEPWIQSGDALCAETVARGAVGPQATPRIARHTKNLDATRGLVAAGLGIALVSTLSGGEEQPGAVIRPVRPVPEYAVLAVLPPSSNVLPAAQALRDLLLATAGASLALNVQDDVSRLETPTPVPRALVG